MKAKVCAFVAVVLILCTILCTVSCSKDDPDIERPTGSHDTNEKDPNNEYEVPNVNYSGKEVTVASYNYSGEWSFMENHVAMIDDVSTPIKKSIVQRNLAIEEELGVIVNLYTLGSGDRGNSTVIQSAILQGDKVFDFALPMSAGIGSMLRTMGMLVDLNEIETLDLSKSWWNQNANDEYSLYGQQYAAVGDICLFNTVSPIVTFFSKDMIVDYGLEDPYELAEKGTWTLDKMISMSAQVSRSLDGNDSIDNEDQFGFAGEISSLLYLVFGTGVRLTDRDADGNIVLAVNTDKTVSAVDKILALLRNNEVSRVNNLQVTGIAGFHKDYAIPKMASKNLLFLSFQFIGAIEMTSLGINFGIVPNPKYDVAQEEYYTYSNSWFSDHLIVPGGAMTPDLEMVGYVIDAMGYYAQQYITPTIIDESLKLRNVTDETSAKWVDRILDTQVFDIGYIFNWGGLKTMFERDMVVDNKSFTTLYKENEEKIISALEDTILDMGG